MSKIRRVIVVLGAIGVLHSSMVPPISQISSETCRYHEFVERSLLFTRTYGVNHGDLPALLSEYGVILALTVIAYVVAGGFKKTA